VCETIIQPPVPFHVTSRGFVGPNMSGSIEKIQTRLHSITWAARDICLYERRSLASPLPPYSSGAHVDIHLPNGLIRSYSLVNPPDGTGRYVIAVSRDPANRGGSRYIRESLRAGDTIAISAPRNNFELKEDSPRSIFIAGGIGITPLWCMIQRLAWIRGSWQLYYSARSRQQAAFLQDIRSLGISDNQVHTHFNDELGDRLLDLARMVQNGNREAISIVAAPADAGSISIRLQRTTQHQRPW
jgi:vanillate O-demethylase ferredoxin subunit